VEGAFQKVFAGSGKGTNAVDLSGLTGGNKDFVATHIISTNFILDHIADVPAIAGPKFTYVHLFIPHAPFVYGPDGQIETDPGYYGGARAGATTEAYQLKGYVNQVEYIDKRIVPILNTVISKSERPPIIILMAIMAWKMRTGSPICWLIICRKNGNSKLYPTISPVNTFRLIFDEYFGRTIRCFPI